jgi:hypothetical protein
MLFKGVMNVVALYKNPGFPKHVAVTPRKRNRIITSHEPTLLICRETRKLCEVNLGAVHKIIKLKNKNALISPQMNRQCG